MEILGIDVGGSRIKGAVVDIATGELCSDFLQLETPQPVIPQAVARTIGRLVESFKWGGTIGCGFPAVIHSGVAMTAANIDTDWIGCNVQQLLEHATACPCAVINDADAAGLAEVKYGAGRERPETVLMLTLGTGIGSALFSEGRLFPNIELGHLTIAGMPAEEYTSAAVRNRENLSWEEWSARLNLFLGHVERLFSPELIVVGGGVSEQADRFFPYLKTQAELVPAQLQNRAGIVGAACFAAGST
jgi:polyphosphate glucokinase